MNFIIIGLCTKGEVMYQLDTIKQVIKPGDILVVSDRHIVDSYQHSEDMEGLCMVMSVNFFREISGRGRDPDLQGIFPGDQGEDRRQAESLPERPH